MICPFCGTEMIHGYLNCDMTLWSTKKHKWTLLVDDTERYTLKFGKALMFPHHVESECCPKCKRVIIDTSNTKNNLE